MTRPSIHPVLRSLRHFVLIRSRKTAASPSGAQYVDVNFFGEEIPEPTLTTLMTSWLSTVVNMSILALVNQGDISPQDLYNEATSLAEEYIGLPFSPQIPDANMATAVQFAQQVQFEANLVPPVQWSPSTYNPSLPDTIGLAMAANVPPAPAPPPSNQLIGGSYTEGTTTVYLQGSGVVVSGNNFSYMGSPLLSGMEVVDQSTGKSYQVVITLGLAGIGAQICFYAVSKMAA